MKNKQRSLTLQEIADVIGEDQALQLISQIGGITYYFPENCQQGRHVALDQAVWEAMCKHFAGWVYIPKGQANRLDARNAEIREKRAAGAGVVELAIEYQLSDRQIRTICDGVRVEPGVVQANRLEELKKPFRC
ncbi:Mor transcription activator family protein [Methylomonas koyamae]|uniref:Mor transcription activator family protein n=1 Tax=Methylomonas koyamae TaxID=702114 RepID=UPI000BC35112|nr:Mor transcription activator family protein [Methylomonas koyamae]ATG91408.1 hypothetical protein MKLM6_3214 [Methylomonas koyamae]